MDIAKTITDTIIQELEKGTAPWVKPWSEACEAYNPITGTIYRGMNQIWLGMAGLGRSNAWLTFKQCAQAQLRVRKGSKGVPIVFWKPLELTKKNNEGEDALKVVPMLRHYFVFNADDVEGASFQRQSSTLSGSVDQAVTDVVARLGLAGGVQQASSAYYQATRDLIGIPDIASFRSVSDYAAILLHEAVHATGHTSRLDRPLRNRYGTEAYAFEELVAELGAAMLCMKCGIDGQLQHSSYIASWLKVLRDDKTAIIKAASLAQKALDFLTEQQSTEELLAA